MWSNQLTRVFGSMFARGGLNGGNGGLLEVSGRDGHVAFGGRADAGAPNGVGGTLLIDPHNIVIDASAGGSTLSQRDLLDPNPNAGGTFGDNLMILGNGNTVVTDINDNFGGAGAGAAYLFNGSTGGLISVLIGSHANDFVGSGGFVQLPSSGNYLVVSPNWNSAAGAVTPGNAATGVSGVLSAANSLVGANPGDNIGSNGIQILNTGNYVVLSLNFNGKHRRHHVRHRSRGREGNRCPQRTALSAARRATMPVPMAAKEFLQLASGNLLFRTQNWSNSGTATIAGAVTWMSVHQRQA